MTQETKENKPAIPQQKTLADQVMARIHQFEQTGELTLPKNYSAENALKSAYLTLVETVDKNKKPVLETCTKNSIVNSLLQMVIEGLSPMKKQCYFIAYGNKLSMQRSYAGSLTLAKRVSNLVDVVPNIVYEGDKFVYEIDPKTGKKTVKEHQQEFQNIDHNKIKGGYAVRIYDDGTSDIEIMNMFQIRASWSMSRMSNNPTHDKFTDQMIFRTLINRACKLLINSSDDATLHTDDEVIDPERKQSEEKVLENTGTEEIFFDEAQIVEDEPQSETPKKEPEKQPEPQKKPETKKETKPEEQGSMFPGGPDF